jgi:SAM-dependent methyltransferase
MSRNSYDLLPYKTLPQRDTNPSRMGAIARVLGIDAPSAGASSVLEIGCGTGGNLFPLAERFPESRFVGIDLSGRHIQDGIARSQELGLKNLELVCADFSDFSCKKGEFDYVICHGVYSWIPEKQQQLLMALVAQALALHGVAYLSYNVLPGWHQRGMIRDVLAFGAQIAGGEGPETRVQTALEFLKLVADSRQQKKGAGREDMYGSYLQEALQRLQAQDPSYIAHEYLEESNNPCTFTQFVADARARGLQFLLEAKPVYMSFNDLGQEPRDFFDQLGDDLILREQALDIFRNRAFRETLLCHEQHLIKRDLKASAFMESVFVSDYVALGGGIAQRDSVIRFAELSSGKEISLPAGLHAHILAALSSACAAGMKLTQIAEALQGKARDERELMAALAALWSSGFIGIEQLPVPAARDLSGIAHISKLAHLQAERGEAVATLRHQSFEPSAAEREVLCRCDGKLLLADLIEDGINAEHSRDVLFSLVKRGVLIA